MFVRNALIRQKNISSTLLDKKDELFSGVLKFVECLCQVCLTRIVSLEEIAGNSLYGDAAILQRAFRFSSKLQNNLDECKCVSSST